MYNATLVRKVTINFILDLNNSILKKYEEKLKDVAKTYQYDVKIYCNLSQIPRIGEKISFKESINSYPIDGTVMNVNYILSDQSLLIRNDPLYATDNIEIQLDDGEIDVDGVSYLQRFTHLLDFMKPDWDVTKDLDKDGFFCPPNNYHEWSIDLYQLKKDVKDIDEHNLQKFVEKRWYTFLGKW